MAVQIDGKDYITVKEAAEAKSVGVSTIHKAIDDERLTATKILGRVMIEPVHLAAYEPGSYGGIARATVQRGPGRGKARK